MVVDWPVAPPWLLLPPNNYETVHQLLLPMPPLQPWGPTSVGWSKLKKQRWGRGTGKPLATKGASARASEVPPSPRDMKVSCSACEVVQAQEMSWLAGWHTCQHPLCRPKCGPKQQEISESACNPLSCGRRRGSWDACPSRRQCSEGSVTWTGESDPWLVGARLHPRPPVCCLPAQRWSSPSFLASRPFFLRYMFL
jgi:hypothetical protein